MAIANGIITYFNPQIGRTEPSNTNSVYPPKIKIVSSDSIFINGKQVQLEDLDKTYAQLALNQSEENRKMQSIFERIFGGPSISISYNDSLKMGEIYKIQRKFKHLRDSKLFPEGLDPEMTLSEYK